MTTADTGPSPYGPNTSEARADADELTLAYLRVLRAGQRRRDRRGTLLALYATLLTGLVWLGPYLFAAGVAARDGSLRGPLAERVLAAVPAVLPVLVATVLLVAARRACWRGPVLPDGATVDWLLPHPVARARVLLPLLRRAVLFSLAAGAALGAVGGFLLYPLGASPGWASTLLG
ncbi:hypothetical protein GL263_21880, partial [Streptomyces durbertensis]|nr:hypothetical protein [Streptomyces durbertensis]